MGDAALVVHGGKHPPPPLSAGVVDRTSRRRGILRDGSTSSTTFAVAIRFICPQRGREKKKIGEKPNLESTDEVSLSSRAGTGFK